MSFGFSIGDFVTVIELANQLRKDFVSAPVQFKALSNEYGTPGTSIFCTKRVLLINNSIGSGLFQSRCRTLKSIYPTQTLATNKGWNCRI